MSGTPIPVWRGDDDSPLVVRRVIDETADVKTFVFSAREPRLFDYQPGQFLTFDFEIEGKPVNRCYTLASTPTRPHTLSITVKRVPGGAVSPWLHANLKPGMMVPVQGPMGSFTNALHPAPNYLFLSAGSGITPLMSMARAAADRPEAADIVFVHSAQSPADIIFREEIELIARRLPGFRAVFVCETGPWSGFTGRLTLPMLQLIAPDLAEREIFTCGPVGYMASVRDLLKAAGIDPARYHEESFIFEQLPIAEAVEVAAEAHGFKVNFTKSAKIIECGPETTVLAAARAAGMRLPFSCTQGVCGTCKSKLTEGKVDMKHGGGIRQREIDQGQILICCSKPLTDLVIDR